MPPPSGSQTAKDGGLRHPALNDEQRTGFEREDKFDLNYREPRFSERSLVRGQVDWQNGNENELKIEASGEKTFGPCGCCGEMTKRIWGFVYDGEAALAAYFVEWTPGQAGGSANFDLIVGAWGDDADSSTRRAICLEFRRVETGPAFMVIDAPARSVATSPLISVALSREEVIGSETASLAFSICDAIYFEDPRLRWMRQ